MRNRRLDTFDDFEEFGRDEDRGRGRGRGIATGVMRLAMRRPLDSLAMTLAFAASVTIVVNALAMQDGAHPAPLYGSGTTQSAGARPGVATVPARPVNQTADPLVRDIQGELTRRGIYDGAVDGVPGPRTDSAIRSFQIAAGLAPSGEATEDLLAILMIGKGGASRPAAASQPASGPETAPTAVSPSVALVADVQKLLSEKGFGPLQVDGLIGEATRGAIRRFEASRGLPERGEATPELRRLLQR